MPVLSYTLSVMYAVIKCGIETKVSDNNKIEIDILSYIIMYYFYVDIDTQRRLVSCSTVASLNELQ